MAKLTVKNSYHDDQNQLGKERVYLHLQLEFIINGSQGSSQKAGTEADAMEEWQYLRICSSWLVEPAFLDSLDHSPGVVPLTVGWDLSRQSLTKKMLHRLAQRPIC